jgi:hypothetical protein
LLACFFIAGGFLSASLTLQVPHNNQAILALPGFILLAILGLLTWKNWWKKHQQFFSSFILLTLILTTLSFLQYQKTYFQVYSSFNLSNNSKYYFEHQLVEHLFAQNLLDAFTFTRKEEKNYQQVVVATDFEQPYIYALLAKKTKPISYQSGLLSEKYLFVEWLNFDDLERKNSLILASPSQISTLENFKQAKPLKIYFDLNNEPNLYIYETLN